MYKRTILPIFDYADFLLLSLSNGELEELQIMQYDILRICNKTKLSDKVTLVELHKNVKYLALGLDSIWKNNYWA